VESFRKPNKQYTTKRVEKIESRGGWEEVKGKSGRGKSQTTSRSSLGYPGFLKKST